MLHADWLVPCGAEQKFVKIRGEVSGHPDYPDGHAIITSLVQRTFDGTFIETRSGSVYALGDVDVQYVSIYPNAKVRLIERADLQIGLQRHGR